MLNVKSWADPPDSQEVETQTDPVLQLGEFTLAVTEVVPRLWQYGLMPHLLREMVIDRATADIQLSPAEAANALEALYKTHQLQSAEQQASFAQQRGLSPQALETLAQREQKLEKFKQETWAPKLESYFLQRKSRLDRILYSLIRTQEAGLAQELYFRINDDGESFADIARDYSEGQEAQTGGLIGPVELSVPHPALARILAISQPGQLWPPTQVGEWFVIVRLEKFLPAQFDQMTRQRLLDELYTTWLQERLESALQGVQLDPIHASLTGDGAG